MEMYYFCIASFNEEGGPGGTSFFPPSSVFKLIGIQDIANERNIIGNEAYKNQI